MMQLVYDTDSSLKFHSFDHQRALYDFQAKNMFHFLSKSVENFKRPLVVDF